MIFRFKTPIYALLSFGRMVWQFLINDDILAYPHQQEKRLAICKKCELYVVDSKQCSACGCFIPIKVKFIKERCPHPRRAKW